MFKRLDYIQNNKIKTCMDTKLDMLRKGVTDN